jgi:hypothetical protein
MRRLVPRDDWHGESMCKHVGTRAVNHCRPLMTLLVACLTVGCGKSSRQSDLRDAANLMTEPSDAGGMGKRPCRSDCETSDWPEVVVARTGQHLDTELTIEWHHEGKPQLACEPGGCPPPKFFDGTCTCGFWGTPDRVAELTATTADGRVATSSVTVPDQSCPLRLMYVELEMGPDGPHFAVPHELRPCE